MSYERIDWTSEGLKERLYAEPNGLCGCNESGVYQKSMLKAA